MPHKKPGSYVLRTTITFDTAIDSELIMFINLAEVKAYTIKELLRLGYEKFKELNKEGYYDE